MLFDFGGTLDADGVHWSPRFHAAYRAVGGGLDFAAFETFFKASDTAVARLPDIRALGFRAAIDAQARLLAGFLPDRVDPGVIAQRLHADALAIVTRNTPVLERLARRYKLGVVSNFTGNLQPCLQELGLARFFSVMSDSALVGWSKPDARIFTHTLDALGVSPQRVTRVHNGVRPEFRPLPPAGSRRRAPGILPRI